MEKSTFLFFREGSSDKVYNVHLRQDEAGWTVAAENGRRGKALRETIKTSGVSLQQAEKVWEKTVSVKVKGGYTEQESGMAFSSSALAGQDTGFRPQLLNEISHEDAMTLGPDWLVQKKHDGERRGLIFQDGAARFSNRRGLDTGVAKSIDDAFQRLGEIVGEVTLDAEDMGDHAVIFDVPRHFMIREGSFRERASILAKIAKDISYHGLEGALKVDIPIPADEFFAGRAAELQVSGAEGYVLRHADSLYEAGRPSSGGGALKVKFWAEATCRVSDGREGKRSIGLELQDGIDGPWVHVGNVTVPANQNIPEKGALVEVRYLYAYEGGSLFQPILKGLRGDLTADAAQISQLKFKTEESDAEAYPSL